MDEENPCAPAPPPKELLKARPPQSASRAETDPLKDFLRQRLESMESELSKERENARKFESLLRQQDAVRGEADRQLKLILEQLKTEKTQREREEERSHAQGRIEALEKRLDEMHASWLSMVKEATVKRDSNARQLELQSLLENRLQEFKQSFEKTLQRQETDAQTLLEVRELLAKTQVMFRRPEKAKDQILKDIETEKQDLMKALEERSAALREHILERREVERTLGDSVMDLHRKLDAERAKEQSYESKIAELKLQLEASQHKDVLIDALKAERDNLFQSQVEMTRKLQQAAAERAQSEQSWMARNESLRKDLEEGKIRSQSSERQISDLEAKIQALSDHLAKIIREQEKDKVQGSQWQAERDKLLAELRQKEDLLAMISATFQGLLKK